MAVLDDDWQAAVVTVLEGSHLSTGDALVPLLDKALAPLGLVPDLFLVDEEQQALRALRPCAGPPIAVDGTLPGRSYVLNEVHSGTDDDGLPLLWVPLIDGTERLGLLRLGLAVGTTADAALRESAVLLAGLVAHMVTVKSASGDTLVNLRRERPMPVASELLWQQLPPLTFGCPGLALAAVLEPVYGVGGDAFDYAVTGRTADLTILDSSGHDLSAGLTTSVALAASRVARRRGCSLVDRALLVDRTLTDAFDDHRFVTGVLGELDLDTGRFRYLNAGHPPPVLLREGRAVRTLDGGGRLPLGRVAGLLPAQGGSGEAVEDLQPGDRLLLHSDGIVEATGPDGEEFGVERLVELAERSAAAGLPSPETLRRLTRAVHEHRHGELHDDATIMLVEWEGRGAERLLTRAGG